MIIDENLLKQLFDQAIVNSRLRVNYDLRNSEEDGSQRMLNALLPGTQVPIHRHPNSSESVIVICGSVVEVYYDDNGQETERIPLCPVHGSFGCQIPKNTWHSIEAYEPSVIIEVKDGRYGEDGSEQFDLTRCNGSRDVAESSTNVVEVSSSTSADSAASASGSKFDNSLGDLKKNIEYLIGMERHSGSMEVITPLYVSRMLNVPLADVEEAMKEIGL